MSEEDDDERPFDEAAAAIRTGKLMEELVKHPGWKPYQMALEQRLADQRLLLERPLKNLDEAISENWHKGAIHGLGLALRIPHDSVDYMKGVLRDQAKERKEQ